MHYTGQVVSDVQGYFSVFGSGPPPICLKEQFFAKDYDPLTYDHAGWCEDATTQQPPHLLPRQLADSEMTPYPDVLQPAFGGSACSLPRFWYASHSLSQGGSKTECARWHRFEEVPRPDPGPARAPDRTDATKLSKVEMLTSGGYELGTVDHDASDAHSDTTPRRNSRSLGAAPVAATSAASAGRSNVRTIVDLSQSDASAPVYREDDGVLSDSGTDSEGEAFDHEEEAEDEEEDEEEEEDTDEEDEEEDDEEDYDFGSTRRTRATRASSRRAPSESRSSRGARRDTRSARPAARASGARVSSRRRAAAGSEDSDYSDEEVQPTRRSTRPRKRARVALESDEESEDEDTRSAGGARGGDDDYDEEAEDGEGEQFDEEGWYETQEDDTIQSISAWHGLDEDELLDMNRRRIRGLSQCKPAIAKKMALKKGTWLQLSEVVGPGWGDAEDEDVPVVDHASRRRQRAATAQGGGRAAAAASPRGNKKKKKAGKQNKAKKPDKPKKQNGRAGANRAGTAVSSRAEKNPNEMIPRNAFYWLNEHYTFLFRYVPQVRSPKLTVAFSQSSYILMTCRVVGTR